MREIKFRAWDKRHKSMEQMQDLYWFEENYVRQAHEADSMTGDWVIMQYTGLKDKNGMEIYEGDILLTNNGNYHIETALPFVSLVDKSGLSYDNGDYYEGYNIESHNWKKFEVIGNMYENPELLNGNKE